MMEWKVVVANTGEDSITVINLKNYHKKRKNINIFLDNRSIGPWDLILSSKKNKIYITNAYDNSIFKIDIKNMDVEDMVIVGKFPSTIKAYDGAIYVLNQDSNSISIVDEKSFELIGNIPVGEKPGDMKIYRQSKKIIVANNNAHSIDIIDLKDNKVEKFKLNDNPIKLCLEKKFMYILSHSDKSFSDYSRISIINLDSLRTIMSLDFKGIFNNMLKPKGKDMLFLTSLEDGHLYKINLKNNKVIKKFYLDGMPNKIFWDGDKLLFITNISKNILTIFNISHNKIVKNIKVGTEPNGIIII